LLHELDESIVVEGGEETFIDGSGEDLRVGPEGVFVVLTQNVLSVFNGSGVEGEFFNVFSLVVGVGVFEAKEGGEGISASVFFPLDGELRLEVGSIRAEGVRKGSSAEVGEVGFSLRNTEPLARFASGRWGDHLGGSLGVGASLEFRELHVLDGEVTVVHDVGALGASLDFFELFANSDLSEVVVVGVRFPLLRVLVGEAGLVLGDTAVFGIAGFLLVGSSGGIDVDVGGEVGLEHGSGIAGFNVEHELLVHLLLIHVLENLVEFGGISVAASGEGNQTAVAVIVVEDEDIIFGGGLKDFSSGLSSITDEDGVELGGSDVGALVVNVVGANVNIGTVGNVEDLARERIGGNGGDIIIAHGDNLGGVESVLGQNLVGSEDIGLMTVVAEAIGTGNDNSPVG